MFGYLYDAYKHRESERGGGGREQKREGGTKKDGYGYV